MSKTTSRRIRSRHARHERIRRRISGTAERPRLCVRRTLQHMIAQIVDDTTGRSLLQVASFAPEVRNVLGVQGSKTDCSRALGRTVATRALEMGIKAVVFDRGGYLYHGRVQALAEGAREGGLTF